VIWTPCARRAAQVSAALPSCLFFCRLSLEAEGKRMCKGCFSKTGSRRCNPQSEHALLQATYFFIACCVDSAWVGAVRLDASRGARVGVARSARRDRSRCGQDAGRALAVREIPSRSCSHRTVIIELSMLRLVAARCWRRQQQQQQHRWRQWKASLGDVCVRTR
jgi:hypothetical protein